jgi:hypothetical protein
LQTCVPRSELESQLIAALDDRSRAEMEADADALAAERTGIVVGPDGLVYELTGDPVEEDAG